MISKNLVIITGASSGIGATLASAFSSAGYPVALIARNLEAMEQLQLPKALCLSADVRDYAALNAAVKRAEAELGPADCLINNAGYGGRSGDFVELDLSADETLINTNILGVIHGMRAVLPGMRERKKGTIINISSLADRNARAHITTYAATKAAVKSLSASQRVANAKYGIRVCNIAPAKVLTSMLLALYPNSQDTISVDHFAETVLWVYQQPQNICIEDLVITPTAYAL